MNSSMQWAGERETAESGVERAKGTIHHKAILPEREEGKFLEISAALVTEHLASLSKIINTHEPCLFN